MTRNAFLVFASSLGMFLSAPAQASPLFEVFTGLAVEDPADVIAAIDDFFATDDTPGHTVTLVETVFDGTDPENYWIVTEHDSYASYETLRNRRNGSVTWGNLMTAGLALRPTYKGMGIVRADFGDGWPKRSDYVAVYNLVVKDADRYREAFDKMARATKALELPGTLRLLEVRAGGVGPTHYVYISAPTFAALNEYPDALFASDAYEKFASEVSGIRTVMSQAIFKRVKTWSK